MKKLSLPLIILAMISCKKDQPLGFTDTDCSCPPSGYKIPVEFGDTTPVQFNLANFGQTFEIQVQTGTGTSTPASGVVDTGAHFEGFAVTNNTIKNITADQYDAITDVTSDTVLDAGIVVASGDDYAIFNLQFNGTYDESTGYITIPNGGGILIQHIVQPGKYYRIEADILATGTVSLVVSVDGTGTGFSSTGTNVRYVVGGSGGTGAIVISNSVPVDAVITGLRVYTYSQVGFTVKRCDNDATVFTNTDGTGVTYFQNYAMITLDWDSMALDSGCYYICMLDTGLIGYEFIRNGGFDESGYGDGTTSEYWDITNAGSNGWAANASKMQHSTEVSSAEDTFEQAIPTLDPDVNYTLSFDVISGIPYSLKLYADSAELGANHLMNTFVGSSGATRTYNLTGGSFTAIRFGALGTAALSVDNVSLIADETTLPCSCQSECVNLQTSQDAGYGCNLLLVASCNSNGFGFNFADLGFEMRMRIRGIIRNASYKEPVNIQYKDSNGLYQQPYTEVEKSKELQTTDLPEFVHDALAVMLNCDNVTINGKAYIKVPGDISPVWRKTNTSAPVTIEIKEKQQLPSKNNCA